MTQQLEMMEYTKVTTMAAGYKQSIKEIGEGIALIDTATKRLNRLFNESYAFDLDIYYDGSHRDPNEETTKDIEDHMRRRAWRALIAKLGIRKIMSSKRCEELDEELDGRSRYDRKPTTLPDIDEQTIMDVLNGMVQSADEFLQEAIHEEYDFWKPDTAYHAKYKRNSEFKLNRKIIRGGIVRKGGYGTKWSLSYYNDSHVTALDNIFHMLDGQGFPKGYRGPLGDAIQACDESGYGETDFFSFRCCKNGNIHLTFKREDLLAKFNEIAGRNRLPKEDAA